MAVVNYVASAVDLDTHVSFLSDGDPTIYETLKWATSPILKAMLESHWLIMQEQVRAAAIVAAATATSQAGFKSDALVPGTYVTYSSDLQGQIAIVGALVYLTPINGVALATSYTIPYFSVTGAQVFAAHSYAQILELFNELAIFYANNTSKLQSKIAQINAIGTGNVNTDLDTLALIVWP